MSDHNHHIVPVKTYLAVFAGLVVLLILTVVVAFFHFGPFNKVIALVIAISKAVLIVAFFMHLRYSPRLTWIFAGLGFFGLTILLILSMGDYLARGGVVVPF